MYYSTSKELEVLSKQADIYRLDKLISLIGLIAYISKYMIYSII